MTADADDDDDDAPVWPPGGGGDCAGPDGDDRHEDWTVGAVDCDGKIEETTAEGLPLGGAEVLG